VSMFEQGGTLHAEVIEPVVATRAPGPRGATWMWVYLGANVPLVIAVFALPEYHTYLWGLLGLGSAAAVTVGVVRNQPSRRWPWLCISLAIAAFASGDITYDILTKVLGESNPFPSIADAFYLATGPLLVAGFAGMVRARRRRDGDSGALLDALVISLGLTVLSWIYLIQPYVHAAGMPIFAKLTSILYPVMDILILCVLARLLFGGGTKNESVRLLSMGAIGLLVADCVYGWIQLNGSWAVGGPTDLGWVAMYVCFGAAALHPVMRAVTDEQPRRVRLKMRTLVVLTCAALIPPVLVTIRDAKGIDEDAGLLAGASVVVFALVILRLTGLMRVQAGQGERELVLHRFSEQLVGAKERTDVFGHAMAAVELIGGRAVLGCVVVDITSRAATVTEASDPTLVGAIVHLMPLRGGTHQRHLSVSGGPAFDARFGTALWSRLLTDGDPFHGEQLLLAHADPLPVDLEVVLDGVATELAMALERVESTNLAHEAKTQARFQALVQSASDVILIGSSDGVLRAETPSITSLLGYPLGASFRTGDLLDADDAEHADTLLEAMLSGTRMGPIRTQWRVRHADGRWLDMEVIANDLSTDPNIGGVMLTMRDVSDRTRLEVELRHRAFHDGLTDLANRELLIDRVEHALNRQGPDDAASLLMLDLDDFKLINDKFGHVGGDQILIQVGQRLRSCLRAGDTAARLGGDEFAVFVESEGGTGPEAGLLAGRILEAFRDPFSIDGAEVSSRVSIGVATAGAECLDAAQLLRDADLALYAAKNAGKNTHKFFEPGLHQAVLARLERRDELERALALGQLRLHYQPIVRLDDGELVGLEALVRWQHPTLGLLAPDEFIAVAEESGLIVPLGRWVLEQACADLSRWQRSQRVPGDPLRMSVNVSPRQLQAPHFPEEVIDALRRHHLAASTLTLEITESVLLHDVDTVMSRLVELHAAGLTLALDDFGTGYSSLSYLHRFPISVIKIDRSFVQRIEDDDGLTILDAIVALARSLNLELVAEGIEEESQARQLHLLGCGYGQGFFYGRPKPADEIEKLVSTWSSPLHCKIG
jgi:diguanylate cyclase (GGDEF)-like protein/PAS domain S-box-containing protein